jgi:hypothetical protein
MAFRTGRIGTKRRALLGIAACMSFVLACSQEEQKREVAPEPLPSGAAPSATPSASSSTASKAPPKPPEPPTLKRVVLELPEVEEAVSLHTIDGAVMVATKRRVGRLVGKKVEWIGKIPPGSKFIGPTRVRRVVGKWPEEVAAIYHNDNGRAPSPTYFPLKGDGGPYEFSSGGGSGWVAGAARRGETTTIAGYDLYKGHHIVKVRGPMVKPALRPADADGCEAPKFAIAKEGFPAVPSSSYTATRAGTIISLGTYCKTKGAALEVWQDPTKASTIISVAEQLGEYHAYQTELLRGRGDTLYVVPPGKRPILRYHDGKVSALPKLDGVRHGTFVSPHGALFASDGLNVFELVDGGWVKRFELDWSDHYLRFAKLDDHFLAVSAATIYELQETKPIALDPKAASVDCDTPMVHVFDVSDRTQRGHRFPDSARRLSTFADLDRVKLVDFRHEGRRRIGITADDWETAKAVFAHARKTNPMHHPRLVCYAPAEPRVLEVKPAKEKGAPKPVTKPSSP